jgi:hypothetical protein
MIYDQTNWVIHYDEKYENVDEYSSHYLLTKSTIKQQLKMLETKNSNFTATLFFKSLKNEKIDYDNDIKVKDLSYALKINFFGSNKFLLKLRIVLQR